MKYLAVFISLFWWSTLHASPGYYGPNFKSGDQQIDRWLINIDYAARNNPDKAVRSIARRFGIKQEALFLLRENWEYSVAELYTLCAIAEALGLELEKVIESYRHFRPEQLQEFLKVAGMPPFSAPFKHFKQRIQQGAPKEDLEAEKDNIFKHKPQKPPHQSGVIHDRQ